MDVCRKLQNAYRMEPAGSQGVWNLDDYQFVPFIWGAAQMKKGSQVGPKSIPDYEIANMLADDFHLFACIKHISGEGWTRELAFYNRWGSVSPTAGWPLLSRSENWPLRRAFKSALEREWCEDVG